MGETYERGTIPSEEYRTALGSLLGAHAVAVWCWGERDLYASKVMDGPGLDTWVLTGGLWAEAERRAWDWEQLVSAGIGALDGSLVETAVGELATNTMAAVDSWVDLVSLAACVDGVGEEMARTLRNSSYGPLRRHARVMTMYKRGQSADGYVAVRMARREGGLPACDVDAALERWLDVARQHVDAVAASEERAAWVEYGIAAPLDTSAAIGRVQERL